MSRHSTPLLAPVALLLSLGLGCLSADQIPSEPDASAADAEAPPSPTERCLAKSPDALVGTWHKRGKPNQLCEFFSNGRFTKACGLKLYDPFEWARLDEGRYFFNATNSFGSIVDTCSARPTYEDDCDGLSLYVDCGHELFTLKLDRSTD